MSPVVIEAPFDEMGSFLVNGRNVQIADKDAIPGNIVHIACKSEVRAGTNEKRLMAPYAQTIIVTPSKCTSCSHDMDEVQTICPDCVRYWRWDWFVRYEPKWMSHGNWSSYDFFGCRCPICRIWTKAHRQHTIPRNITNVRTYQLTPSMSVESDLPEKGEMS